MTFSEIMTGSILDNWYIFLNLIAAGVMLYLSSDAAANVEKCFEPGSTTKLEKRIFNQLERRYSVFLALVSIFPLLGMLGTVIALLSLDLTGSTEAVKSNFFAALTSTAWGIIFSVIFKIIHAFRQPYIENQIDKAKRILDI